MKEKAENKIIPFSAPVLVSPIEQAAQVRRFLASPEGQEALRRAVGLAREQRRRFEAGQRFSLRRLHDLHEPMTI